MFKGIFVGAGVALLAFALPNTLSLARPELSWAWAQPLDAPAAASASLNLTPTVATATSTTLQDQDHGTLLLDHRVFYLHRVTAYNAVPWQTSSDPEISACGPTRPDQIALSQDLFFRKDGGNRCGERVEIVLSSGKVVRGVVWDTMNARYKMAADILMDSVHEAVQFGVKEAELRILPAKLPSSTDS
ncbi:hypothetical protein [Acidithiobacillus sp.]|uniref:hypothetical protein n=1 Tax=Acidithiobacillus sp. TaxID=1872118 RepID=UPI0025C60E14|nr:hypothetical protein [Acidithiobacillus sp.]